MIITRTPLRLSFCGGSTDYPSFFEKTDGLVVGSAVTLYSYMLVRELPPFHEHKSRICYREIESVQSNKEIAHRAVREAIHEMDMGEMGLEVFHACDMPGGSGTGSSSSFVVGLLNALGCLRGRYQSPSELAERAIHCERIRMGESVGSQDQTFAAHGGLNAIRFRRNGTTISPLALTASAEAELNNHLMLFYTKENRTSSGVAATYAHSLGSQGAKLNALLALAEGSINAILGSKHEKLGELIDQSWRVKCSLSPSIPTERGCALYAKARVLGAFGGKVTGAGGGGSLLLVAPPEKQAGIVRGLEADGAVHVPFRLNAPGSSVIFSER